MKINWKKLANWLVIRIMWGRGGYVVNSSKATRFIYQQLILERLQHQQVRIQDLVKGGAQVLRPKVADIAKRSRTSEASKLRRGSRARLRALEAFEFLMLKYAFSHILETLFL